MEQEAIVARVEGNQAYVEVGGEGAGCGHCHEAGGCQSGLLTQLFPRAPRQFRIENRIGAAPGDRVVVSVPEGALLRAVFLVYLIPILTLIAGAFAGTALAGASADEGALLGALLGLAAGVLAGAGLRRRGRDEASRPALLRKSSGFCVAKETCR